MQLKVAFVKLLAWPSLRIPLHFAFASMQLTSLRYNSSSTSCVRFRVRSLLLPQAGAATLEQQLHHADAVILQLLTETSCNGGAQVTAPQSPVGFSAEELLPRLQQLAAQAGRDSCSISAATSPQTPSAQLPGAGSKLSQHYYHWNLSLKADCVFHG